MFALIKEALSVWILKARNETLRQCCYDAVAYSVEQALKNKSTESERMEHAIMYLQKVLPGVSRDDCIIHLESIQSKLIGVGANPAQKV